MPVLVIYTSYYYGLSVSSNKIDRVYFQEHIFEDEQGWIFEVTTKETYWGVSAIKSDFYTVGDRDIFRYGSTSRLYSLKLYLDYGTVYYNRKYKKLFELLSEIFPIIKAILIIFSFISQNINKLKVAKKLNEYIIGNEINLFKEKNIKQKNIHSFNNLKFSFNSKKKNKKDVLIYKKKNNLYCSLKDSSKILCVNNNYNNYNFNIKKKEEPKNKNSQNKLSLVDFLNSKPCNTLNVSIINKDIFEVFEKKYPNFPLTYYFFGFILNKIDSKKNNNYLCISPQFDISFSFFTHLIDITSYISLYKQFNSLKKYLLQDNQLIKPEILRKEEKSFYCNNNNKIFSKLLQKNLTFENK